MSYFPDAGEPAFLDGRDDLVRLRHWRALGRHMLGWRLPTASVANLRSALGGTVTDIREAVVAEFRKAFRAAFKERQPQVFEDRAL